MKKCETFIIINIEPTTYIGIINYYTYSSIFLLGLYRVFYPNDIAFYFPPHSKFLQFPDISII